MVDRTTKAYRLSRITFFGLGLSAALVITYTVYSPGLRGTFLFDDFATLPKLSNYGDLAHPRALLYYILGSGHDFGGRPLSHLSFLIDDYAWPSEPRLFKRTNVLLHLLAGTLVLWLGLLLGRARRLGEHTAAWGALLGAALWLLHPLWVSTTLYVVQRMAILSAILVVAGLTTYVSGRLRLARGQVRSGLAGMATGIGLFTPLAYLAKENGALLPLLALVAEATVLRGLPVPQCAQASFRRLRAVLLGLPNLAIVAYFVLIWDEVLAGYSQRAFSLGERLLTEPRALWSYVRDLLLPRIQTGGLYHDDYQASTGLLSPWTTLPALIGLLLALPAALRLRQTRPLLSFAVLFFLAGHTLESTFIPLELYFEHRNYLPAAGLFLAAGLALARAAEGTGASARAARIAGAAVPALLAAFTWLRADLWGDPATQALVWARMHPGSLRAQQQAAITWLQRGNPMKAEQHLHAAIRSHPAEPTLRIQLLGVLCAQDKPMHEAVRETALALSGGYINSGVFRNFQSLIQLVTEGRCPRLRLTDIDHLLQAALAHPALGQVPTVAQDLLYLRAIIALARKKNGEAAKLMKRGLRLAPNPEYALQGAAVLASYGLHVDALELLNLDDKLRASARRSSSLRKRLRTYLRRYDEEKRRLRHLIEQDRARAMSERREAAGT